ncbi:MAG: hypothetical protein IJV40_10940 [Oscillospiraceae bacterium]|nr:hypothetical protein [Oscillospiraceae bacterium]
MKYDAILDLPHWEPRFRLRMPRENRAAQFSPFDPLEGYEEAVAETARETDAERWLDEESISAINRELAFLKPRLKDRPAVTVTWFEPDARKTGGAYQTRTESVKKIDEYESRLILTDGTEIPLDRILSLTQESE